MSDWLGTPISRAYGITAGSAAASTAAAPAVSGGRGAPWSTQTSSAISISGAR